MEKYVCSICGYMYDEAKGIPDKGIAPGTRWEDLPDDWVCPLCGATKSDFEKEEKAAAPTKENIESTTEVSTDMHKLSPLEISALCTNLAQGCEKQYKLEEAALFNELGEHFKKMATPAEESKFDDLIDLIEKDLKENFPNAKAVSSEKGDRGALRALTWSEKVTLILKSLLTRYQKDGDKILENTSVYVCTICGFVYIGDRLPEICPICKVPNWKIEEIKGGQ